MKTYRRQSYASFLQLPLNWDIWPGSWGGRHWAHGTHYPLCSGSASLQAETVTAQGCGCPQPLLYNWGTGGQKHAKKLDVKERK